VTDPCVIGVDIGTSSVKAVALAADGTPLANACVEHPMHHPRPGWAENDPEDWYAGVVRAVRQLAVRPTSVVALSLVSQRDPFVLLDERRRPVAPAISWTDRRTEGEVQELCERLGRAWLIDHTGVVPIAGLGLPILLWTRRHLPDAWSRTCRLLSPKDFVLERICGLVGTDVSMPARSVLNDLRRDDWSDEICAAVDLDPALLPHVRWRPWEPIAVLADEAAAELGLLPGTIVGAGGADDAAATLGAAAVAPGDLCAGTGTASCWRSVTLDAAPDAEFARGDVARHVVQDRWLLEVTIESTGAALRWFRDELCGGEPPPGAASDGYAELLEAAGAIEPGAGGLVFYPFVDGARRAPHYLPDASGCFIGVVSGHTRAHFLRAILEGIAFQYPATLELMDPHGLRSEPIAVVDGEARSALWNQIKADVLGVPVRTPRVIESAAVGAAVLAAQAGGLFGSAEEAVASLVRFDRVYEPDAAAHERYRELHATYEDVLGPIRDAYARHAAASRSPSPIVHT
jgi:xylulokinase